MARLHRFYLESELPQDGPVAIAGPAARQMRTVLRLRPGARVALFNGDGRELLAELTRLDEDGAEARPLEWRRPEVEVAGPLEIRLALLKSDRLEWALQKLTEVGATHISLVETERTIVHPEAGRWERRRKRYERIVIEATEQCGRVRLPQLSDPMDFEAAVAQPVQGSALLAAPSDASGDAEPSRSSGYALLIGPEGGFTGGEIDQALEAGWTRWSLGPRILRAETAAIVGAARLAARLDQA